jgi:hypothetical protein
MSDEEKDLKKNVSFRCTEELDDALEKHAESLGIKKGKLIRLWVSERLAKEANLPTLQQVKVPIEKLIADAVKIIVIAQNDEITPEALAKFARNTSFGGHL